MTKKEKKIPNLIIDREYLKELFNERIRSIDSQGVEILDVKSYKIKQHFDDRFFHYVIQNNVTLRTRKGLRRRCQIFCAAFSGHGRKFMFEILSLVYRNGFDKGNTVVPRPLWYIAELQAGFYVGVPGDNLLEHIKNGNIDKTAIQKIAKGLRELHQVRGIHNLKLKKHSFLWEYLDPTDILGRAYNRDTELAIEIRNQFKELKALHKKIIDDKYLLSHGDFHPENVIINKFNSKQVAIIDFSEGCLAPVYYDMASFLQQLEFMTRSYLTRIQYARLEKIFLDSYWGEVDITWEMMAKMNLYKAWTALKSVVYFMIFEDDANRDFAKYLLEKSINYVKNN